MIENLAAAASDPAFRKPILPGRLHTCAFRPVSLRLRKRTRKAARSERTDASTSYYYNMA
jgi:hypothetical protein